LAHTKILQQNIGTGISNKFLRNILLRFASLQHHQNNWKNAIQHLLWTFTSDLIYLFYLLKLLNIQNKSGIYSRPEPVPFHSASLSSVKKTRLGTLAEKRTVKNLSPVNGLFGHAFIHGG
jgi:hypothetical protein